MHAITMPTFQHAPDDEVEEFEVPISDLDKLTDARYAIDRLIRAAQRHGTAVLAPVTADLEETFLLAMAAAAHVEDNIDRAAS